MLAGLLLIFVCEKQQPVKRVPLTMNCMNCQHRATSFFCNLRPGELETMNAFKQTYHARKRQVLFNENDSVKGLYCVHSGKVKLYKTTNAGNVQILRIAKDADLIGYRGLLGNGKYIASAEVMEDSVICFIPKEKIFQFIAGNVPFALDIMSRIAADISEVESKASTYLYKSGKERLAETLLLLEQSFGTNTEGFINISLTREEIGGITGMAMETIIRILRVWEDEGLVRLHKKYIRILNREALTDIAAIEE